MQSLQSTCLAQCQTDRPFCCPSSAPRTTICTSKRLSTARSEVCRARTMHVSRSSRQLCQSQRQRHICRASSDEDTPKKSTEFGYSRKDVLIIGTVIFGGGIGMYYGLQAAGISPGIAGNYVQLFVVLGLCIGWIGSYIFRVANKDMTYVKQLQNYEEEVMQKRLEEMPESEREKLMASVETERARRAARQQQKEQQQQQR